MSNAIDKNSDDTLILEITEEALVSIASDETASSKELQGLAESELCSVRVRQALASNTACSVETNLLLCQDSDKGVRVALAKKATHICRPRNPGEKDQSKQQVLEILRSLARDAEVVVREALADVIKECSNIPREISQTLARDVAESVALPVLEYSPLLEDKDLLEIISSRPSSGVLCAISKRPAVSEDVSDSLINTQNEDVIPSLLKNSNAQIREDALNRIVEGAQNNQCWQEALITRPKLPKSIFGRIETFISVELINHLYSTGHVDVEGAKALMARVKTRLTTSKQRGAENREAAKSKTRKFDQFSSLPEDEKSIGDAIVAGNSVAVIAQVSHRSKLTTSFVRRVMVSKNAKVIAALCWKAGLTAGLALLIQQYVGRLNKDKCILPGANGDYTLGAKEMIWHLDVFGANRPCNII